MLIGFEPRVEKFSFLEFGNKQELQLDPQDLSGWPGATWFEYWFPTLARPAGTGTGTDNLWEQLRDLNGARWTLDTVSHVENTLCSYV